MTPEEVAQGLIEQIPDWYPTYDDRLAFQSTIAAAIRDAYERAAKVVEQSDEAYYDNTFGDGHIARAAANFAERIRALKGEG